MVNSLNLIQVLGEEERKKIKYLKYDKGEIIHFEGSLCNSIDIIEKGEIIMSNLDIDGKEEIFNYLQAPQIYGNNLIFATNKKYIGDILANSNVALFRIYENDLYDMISNNKEFLRLYLNIIADKSLTLSKKLRVMSIQNVRKRLLLFLDMKTKEGNGTFHLKSITNLAKELSLPRETLSRALNRLIKEEKVTYTNKQLKINKNALDEL